MTPTARRSCASISSTEGTRGEWMSYTPGPIPRANPWSSTGSSTSIRDRAASIEVTSASSPSIASMISLNSE